MSNNGRDVGRTPTVIEAAQEIITRLHNATDHAVAIENVLYGHRPTEGNTLLSAKQSEPSVQELLRTMYDLAHDLEVRLNNTRTGLVQY
jgi:hypothetical protein